MNTNIVYSIFEILHMLCLNTTLFSYAKTQTLTMDNIVRNIYLVSRESTRFIVDSSLILPSFY